MRGGVRSSYAIPRGWYLKPKPVLERFCWRCKAGDHSRFHDDVVGCTDLAGREPTDYVCACTRSRP